MKVKVLRAHGSHYGPTYSKKKGDIFDHRDPAADIAAGVVAPIADAEQRQAKAEVDAAKKPARNLAKPAIEGTVEGKPA